MERGAEIRYIVEKVDPFTETYFPPESQVQRNLSLVFQSASLGYVDLAYGMVDQAHPYMEDASSIDSTQNYAGVFDGKSGDLQKPPILLLTEAIEQEKLISRGANASQFARDRIGGTLANIPDDEDYLEVCEQLDLLLRTVSQELNKREEIGETAAAVVKIVENSGQKIAIVASVGDCRTYLQRGSEIQRISEIDNIVFAGKDTSHLSHKDKEDLQRKFDQVATYEDYMKLSKQERKWYDQFTGVAQELGQDTEVIPHIYIIPLYKGDKMLLCTDGIPEALTEREILEEMLNKEGNIALRLVTRAKDMADLAQQVRGRLWSNQQVSEEERILGNRDDISAIVIEYEETTDIELITA